MTQRARSPVLGFNHNLRHRGRVFHVQTEDSGPAYARLYTHLFYEGTILSSKKQEYDAAAPEDAVRLLMQQLHKAMIKELTHGGHDPQIAAFFASRGEPAVLEVPPPAAVEAVVAHAHPDPAPARAAAVAPPEAAAPPPAEPPPPARAPARVPAPRPKPVAVVKPTNVRRPPVVLSSSADGVVVRRNVVIDVGGGVPPVNGTPPPARVATAQPARPRPAPVVPAAAARDAYGKASARAPIAPDPAPQPLASSQDIQMPWEPRVPETVQPVVTAPVATESAPRTSREIRMPWDPPVPGAPKDGFAAELVNDKSLDEVILEYLSDDTEE
jgi:hypothetical protein